MTDERTIECKLCGEQTPYMPKHLKEAHPTVSEADYQARFPDAPMMSKAMTDAIAQRQQDKAKQNAAQTAMMAKIIPMQRPGTTTRMPLHEVFELPLTDDLRAPPKKGQTIGDPIMIEVMDRNALSPEDIEAIPDIDEGYVYRIDELKDALMGIQLNIPLLVWGLHGAGKTSLVEQICARTNRPWIRVQHTDTTEEAHIVGQMVVRDGATHFDFGPLVVAMLNGWTYVGDEYDFAHAAVIAVYQAVLEGKPLYIKEAPPSQRLIKPHPNFRFIATGNTNGSGDDSGLYSGTKIGNAAAYSRFGVTIQVKYPEKQVEIAILRQRLGLTQDVAEKLVEFANTCREMYVAGELSMPISPRELIRAAMLGMVKGGLFRKGIELAYSNRLDATQSEAVSQAAQRNFK